MKLNASLAFAACLLTAGSSFAQSNIDPNHKFAWCENTGWSNWRDANGTVDGVVVHDTFLSGYIWAENVGWIKVGNGGGPYSNTDGTNFGVNILLSGDLEGFGWGENIGWVNFDTSGNAPDQARYDSGVGRFRGYAWGENVGWINLDGSTHFVATVPGGACDNDPNLLDYHTCPATGGSIPQPGGGFGPYAIDCRVWACDVDSMCEEIPSEGLSPDAMFNLHADVNDDGSVTPADISCLQRWAAGTVVPPFTGCDKGGAGGSVVEFEYIDFAPCRDPKNPDGRGDGSLTPTEISYVQFVGAGNQAPIGDCYYCGGNE
jgi:hypothetical protein